MPVNGSEPPTERRLDQKAVPDDIKSRLTTEQLLTVNRLEGFGWSIKFVRRPLFQDHTVVLFDPSGKRHAILEKDGSLDTTTEIPVR
jgi:hypothetical protein